MNTDDIRATFVRYFEGQGHLHLPGASLVVHGDPSVLFTTAGMQQFKAYYVDPSKAPARRLVTIQRCLRARGLDDDTNAVGDNTHHTFFEMLGNFSFGDPAGGGYFKQEAIAFGYELVTKGYGLPPDRIWATTWAGEPGVPADDEAVAYWLAMGLPRERIRPLNRKPEGGRENFWGPTGDSGPCGPCSEINVDLFGKCPLGAPEDECGPPGVWEQPGRTRAVHDCGRFVEIWNLVFNQFYQELDKSLRPLPHTGIDTGSGFERVAAVLNGVPSAYETDLFEPIIREAEAALGVRYGGGPGAARGGGQGGQPPEATRALRIIADHTRAVTFMIGDGIFPSNEERGYVARRLLRRAVRIGRQLATTAVSHPSAPSGGAQGRRASGESESEPFIARLGRATVERYAPHYPYLRDKQAVIEQTLANEETRFSETLSAGLELLEVELERLERSGERVLPGRTVFRMYDTFGFPVELTREAAEGRGVEIDEAGFRELLNARRRQSREGARFTEVEQLDLPSVAVQFLGYDHLAVDGARVEFISKGGARVVTAEASSEVWVILDRTPFYAERGGQVGDRGWLVCPHGRMEVHTTRAPIGDIVVHVGRIVEGYLAQSDAVRAEVDEPARQATMRHHTATHLLHAALRAELGAHVHQAGSLVAPNRLRFDFSHGQPLTPQQRRAIQGRVNEVVRRNLPVQTDVLPLAEAMRSGAVALFDEKYGDRVRVVSIGGVSKELCGGTHVTRTGDLGLFLLLGESSIGSGMRRVEALAGQAAEDYATAQLAVLDEVAAAINAPVESVPARVQGLVAERNELRRELEAAVRRAAQQGLGSLLAEAVQIQTPAGPAKVLAAQVDAATAPTPERLREVVDWLRDKLGEPSVLIVGTAADSRPQLVAAVSDALVRAGFHAGKLLGEVAQAMGGRGGGRPTLAQGGGGDPAKLPAALRHVRDQIVDRAAS